MSNNLPSRPERPNSGSPSQNRPSGLPKRKLPTGGGNKRENSSMPSKPPQKGVVSSRPTNPTKSAPVGDSGLKKKAPARPKPATSSRPRPTTPRPQPETQNEEMREVVEEVERTSPSTPARQEYMEETQYLPPVEDEYEGDRREPSLTKEAEVPEGFEFEEPSDIDENNTDYLNEGNAVEGEEIYSPFTPPVDEEEASPRAKKKNRKKKKAPKQTDAQERFSNQGARKRNLTYRGLILAVVLFVVGMNVKVVFFPDPVPTPDQVVGVVNENNGVLGFPTGEGATFVQEFATVYLNVKKDEQVDAATVLAKYVEDGAEDDIAASLGGMDNKQSITRGPFVSSSVEQIDENNANYTISAQLNDSSWIYLLVPVYAEAEKNSFVVSGTPTFVSPPAQAKYTSPSDSRSIDDELSSKVEDDVENFFKAWGSSDRDSLTRLISPESTAEARLGLRNAVTLVSLDSVSIYEGDSEDDEVREGTAVVTWESTQGAEEDESGITYKQAYNIVIEKRDTRWYVKDITGAVHTSLS